MPHVEVDREFLDGYLELWEFLGDDGLAGRIAGILIREGWRYINHDYSMFESFPRFDVTTPAGLKTTYADAIGQSRLRGMPGLGPVAMTRIAEHCTGDGEPMTDYENMIEFLGGDRLASRAAGSLARKEGVHTVADLMRLYVRDSDYLRDYLLDVQSFGPMSVDRIMERCAAHVPALRNGGRSTE